MSERDEVLWCPQCRTRQAFNVSGSGRSATCFVCEKEITGTENIRYLAHVALLHYQESRTSREVNVLKCCLMVAQDDGSKEEVEFWLEEIEKQKALECTGKERTLGDFIFEDLERGLR